VFVSLTAAVGARVRLEEVSVRSTSGPAPALEACMDGAIDGTTMEIPEGAAAGQFPLTISATVRIPAAVSPMAD
jgi:hypothetical protein